MMRIARLVVLAALAPALAHAEPPWLLGEHTFATMDRRDGRPVCTETWTFAEGALTVRSGEEVVHSRTRVTEDHGFFFIAEDQRQSNGLADCMGNRSSAATPNARVMVWRTNGGSIFVCNAPARDVAPQVLNRNNCYATLTPSASAR